jgi:ubiquinone/menaquinone biosynthesis C-methylase UbiE
MSADRKQAVQAQFGRQASWYTISDVHRQSEGLAELMRFAAPSPDARALDIATGTGFTALTVAPRCRRVIGLDLTLGMVTQARRLAAERGVANVQFCLGDAEAIPFRRDAFDIVTCRLAAHHFPNLGRAFREMARVARRGAPVILDDTCAPEVPHLAALMNEWEVRRDPSHVANHPPSRLRAMLEECGLRVDAAVPAHVPQVFSDWVRRGGVAESNAASLRASFLGADPDARSAFRIEPVAETEDIRFAWPEIVILSVKP